MRLRGCPVIGADRGIHTALEHSPERQLDGWRTIVETDFERWYAAYPRHVARGAAEKAFPKALKLASLDELIAGAKRYSGEIAGREMRFVCHPATWLNQKRWLDEKPLTYTSEVDRTAHRLRRVELLLLGVRVSSLDARDVTLALSLGKITPEQAREHGFGYLVP